MLFGLIIVFLAGPGSDLSTSAAAAAPPVLWNKCDSDEPSGQGCSIPRGLAADANNGHVFVGDQVNRRIVEFDALGSFTKAWGWDVVASGPGDDTVPPEDQFEMCVPEAGDTCQEGVSGGGVGQLSAALGIELDSSGDVYVVDFSNNRVQKFDRKGNFQLMIGGQVNETTGGNVCPRPGFSSDVCKAEAAAGGGGEPGEFGPWAIGDFLAIDPTDKVYVGDNGRIQRFNTEGVYQSDCTVPGSVQSLDTDSLGNLYAVYEDQLDVRKLAFVGGGECEEVQRFELPQLGEVQPFAKAVAVDAARHVYAFGPTSSTSGTPTPVDPIIEFDSVGNIIDEFGKEEFDSSTGLATNLCPGSEAPGNLYVSNSSASNSFVRAYGTEPIGCFKARTLPATNVAETSATLNGTVNPEGSLSSECRFEYGTTTAFNNTAPCAEGPAAIGEGTEPIPVHADIDTLQAATVYHVRLRARIGGVTETGPDVPFKTLGPPIISGDHVAKVTQDEASLKALVNPEGLATTCHVEYGPTTSYDQSTSAVAVGSDRTDHSVLNILEGLEPGTTYHWRYVCANSAAPNGGVTEGDDHTLTTYRISGESEPCPNAALRTAASAPLPDCRAYEMVSPADKNGADIVAGARFDAGSEGYVQASPDGEKITYAAIFPAFGEVPPNSFFFNQYLGTRQADDGWSSEGIHPPYLGRRIPGTAPGIFREFIAFSPDLCSAWLVDYQTPPLHLDAQLDAANLYRRDNCAPGAASFEALTSAPLPLTGEERSHYVDQYSVQGISDDSRHAVFVAQAKLTADAATGIKAQLYDRFGGDLRLVSVLPNGSAGDPAVGDGKGFANPDSSVVGSGWNFNLEGALSEDGSLVYWTAGGSTGRIYLRQHPEQGIVESECSAAGLACTLPVSSAAGKAFFWAASHNGSKALYSEGNLASSAATLYEFDLGSKESQPLVEGAMGVAGVSEDLSRIYFVSRKALPNSGQNSEEDEAVEGEPNLYLAEGGAFSFVATLVEGDVGAKEPSAPKLAYDLDSEGTMERATRVTPDGGRIAFESRAPLTGFDNTDTSSNRPAIEVFSYEAGGELLCVSCNPSGALPSVRELPEPYKPPRGSRETKVLAAAWIPAWEHPLHASSVISEDGKRLFFNANDALLPRDTNGAQDVYEWEMAGAGGCDPKDPNYFAQNGGCLFLISAGDNPFESEFWEASPDGRDVFFTTESSLLPQDPGSVDLYDARAGGGFPQPTPLVECEGEACQSPPQQPEFAAPASGSYSGPGNPPQTRKPRCPRGKHRVHRRGKSRCVAKGKAKNGKRHQRRASHDRRAQS